MKPTFIPWTLVKRKVNRQVITPLDAPQEFMEEVRQEQQARESLQDTALISALGLAHHWQKLLDSGKFATISEIANAEGLDATQVRRAMRLALLAPGVVEWLVSKPDIVLEKVMRRPWPSSWDAQKQVLPSLSGFLCERSHTMIISFNRKDSYDDPRPIHPGQAT